MSRLTLGSMCDSRARASRILRMGFDSRYSRFHSLSVSDILPGMTQRSYLNPLGKVSEAVSNPVNAMIRSSINAFHINPVNAMIRSSVNAFCLLPRKASDNYGSLAKSSRSFVKALSFYTKRYVSIVVYALLMGKDSIAGGRAIPYRTRYVIPSSTATVSNSMTFGIAKLTHIVSCYVSASVAVWVTIRHAVRLMLSQTDPAKVKVYDLSNRVPHFINIMGGRFAIRLRTA